MALSSKQLAAISALMSAPTIKRAAQVSGIGLRTIHRWRNEDETFMSELRKAEWEAIDQATRRLISSEELAISTMLDILNSPTARNADRLRAARYLLQFSSRLLEGRELQERLSRLEEQLHVKNP